MKRRSLIIGAVIGMTLAVVPPAPALADVSAPGVFKHLGPNDCNGKSECTPSHIPDLPNGQQKKYP